MQRRFGALDLRGSEPHEKLPPPLALPAGSSATPGLVLGTGQGRSEGPAKCGVRAATTAHVARPVQPSLRQVLPPPTRPQPLTHPRHAPTHPPTHPLTPTYAQGCRMRSTKMEAGSAPALLPMVHLVSRPNIYPPRPHLLQGCRMRSTRTEYLPCPSCTPTVDRRPRANSQFTRPPHAQGCRMRNTKTEYVSCPSCGRTLFDLQNVTEEIRSKTGHLPGGRAHADLCRGFLPNCILLYGRPGNCRVGGRTRISVRVDFCQTELANCIVLKKPGHLPFAVTGTEAPLSPGPPPPPYMSAGVSIAIMGCIVNGPGEMADADFG